MVKKRSSSDAVVKWADHNEKTTYYSKDMSGVFCVSDDITGYTRSSSAKVFFGSKGISITAHQYKKV